MIVLALSPDKVPENALERMKAVSKGRSCHIVSNKEEIQSVVANIEVAAGDFPASLLSACPKLRWFQLWYAGADVLQKIPEIKELPCMISTASGIHGQQMTEHLFGMLFAWNRKLKDSFEAQKRHEWAVYEHSDMAVLTGKNMLILGYGTIGAHIAKAAEAFGMHVTGLRRNPEKEASDGIKVLSYASLHEQLPMSDIVVNILPYTPETKAMFGTEQLALMKKSALFANIGRGATVDEKALIQALRDKSIAGALLDVVSEEPLPSDSPLWDLENVMLTSHYSGFHPRYNEMAFDLFIDNLALYVNGKKPKNLVDKQKGY